MIEAQHNYQGVRCLRSARMAVRPPASRGRAARPRLAPRGPTTVRCSAGGCPSSGAATTHDANNIERLIQQLDDSTGPSYDARAELGLSTAPSGTGLNWELDWTALRTPGRRVPHLVPASGGEPRLRSRALRVEEGSGCTLYLELNKARPAAGVAARLTLCPPPDRGRRHDR
ncbi:hypothetical protein ACFVZ4_09190 [Streptomyces goshikiensis]|uniref:hypothetical protein n=1 Tax=Streptomyces goshikiensis TaxID=1942 RepID=UPI003698BD30